MYPFTVSDFLKMLQDARKNYSFFQTAMEQIVAEGITGNCSYYGVILDIWVTKLGGFTDVPERWYPLYYEYRVWIQGAVNVTKPIADVCATGGGTISTETDLEIIDYLKRAVARTDEIIVEVQANNP